MDTGFKVVVVFLIIFAMAWQAQKNPSAFKLAPAQGTSPTYNYSNTLSVDEEKKVREIERGLTKAEREAKKIEQEIEKNRIAAESSVFSQDISLSNGTAYDTNPDTEYLTFTYTPKTNTKLLITGFEIVSTATGKGATIGQGVELSFSGEINQTAPIFLSPGDKVTLMTGRSPIGYSFKLNACTGYFTQFQKFTPNIPKNCPQPEKELLPAQHRFSDACLDYLDRIPSCTMPLQNIPVAYLESECRTFITDRYNYGSCVRDNKNKKDFYKKEWRIYLGRNEELWKNRREVIKLLDLNKKTVDTITY